jgi:F0F1-type ATP synthase membrane subunit a
VKYPFYDITAPFDIVIRSIFVHPVRMADIMPEIQTLSLSNVGSDLHTLQFGLFTNLMMPLIISSFFTVLSYVKGFVYLFNRVVLFVYKNMVYQYSGDAGRKYFPFFLYLFVFIASSNILGLMPNVFSLTSNLAITFFLSSVS